MSKTNVTGKIAESIGGSLQRVNDAADKIVSRTADLEKKTLDRFHEVHGGLDEWDAGLKQLDDMWGQNSNGPQVDEEPFRGRSDPSTTAV